MDGVVNSYVGSRRFVKSGRKQQVSKGNISSENLVSKVDGGRDLERMDSLEGEVNPIYDSLDEDEPERENLQRSSPNKMPSTTQLEMSTQPVLHKTAKMTLTLHQPFNSDIVSTTSSQNTFAAPESSSKNNSSPLSPTGHQSSLLFTPRPFVSSQTLNAPPEPAHPAPPQPTHQPSEASPEPSHPAPSQPTQQSFGLPKQPSHPAPLSPPSSPKQPSSQPIHLSSTQVRPRHPKHKPPPLPPVAKSTPHQVVTPLVATSSMPTETAPSPSPGDTPPSPTVGTPSSPHIDTSPSLPVATHSQPSPPSSPPPSPSPIPSSPTHPKPPSSPPPSPPSSFPPLSAALSHPSHSAPSYKPPSPPPPPPPSSPPPVSPKPQPSTSPPLTPISPSTSLKATTSIQPSDHETSPLPPVQPSHHAPLSPTDITSTSAPQSPSDSSKATLLSLSSLASLSSSFNSKDTLPSKQVLNTPSPPNSPPPTISTENTTDPSDNVPQDTIKIADEEVFLKQEVVPVEHSLKLAQADDSEISLKLVSDKSGEDHSKKQSSIEDLIKEMEIDEQIIEIEDHQPLETTPSKSEVQEELYQNKTIDLTHSAPLEDLFKGMEIVEENTQESKQRIVEESPPVSLPYKPSTTESLPSQHETIGLAANDPPVFRKDRHDLNPRNIQNMPPPRNARHLGGHHSDSEDSTADDQSSWYISPPANTAGRKTNGNQPAVIDTQPNTQSNVWVPYTLDPVSKAELEDLSAKHKTHGMLKNILKTELGEMSKEEDKGAMLNDSISYTEFFRGLLYDDEEILLNNQFIPFRHVVFSLIDQWLPVANATTNQETEKVQVMRMGRVILTNHRLILISAEQQKGAELHKLDLDNDKAGAYQIRTNANDTLHFRSIPLNKFHSIEMQAAAGISKTTTVTGSRMSCCSCRCLPSFNFFSKRWYAGDSVTSRTNLRLVTCGVVLPPWDSKAALQIYMDPSVPLYHIKNFMLELQKNAPGLHPSAAPSFAGY